MMANLVEKDSELLNRIKWDKIERSNRSGKSRIAIVFLAPGVIMVTSFLLLPVAYNIWTSLTKWKKFIGFNEFTGLTNYKKIVNNIYFNEAMTNTLIWVISSIIFPVMFGLMMALFFRNLRGANIFKNIIFIPRILSPTAVGLLWYYIYAPNGLLNLGLSKISGHKIDIGWLYQSETITPAIIATFSWQTCGLAMVLLLLGLNAIPKSPIEAAYIDGANKWQLFRYITLPLLMPTILMVIILSVLAGFTAFDLLWIMGANYPGQRSLSLTVFMYFESFQNGSWGFGSAVAVVIGIVTLAVTWIQVVLQTRVIGMTK
ncbi:MAG: carbohydrate ABC transporter permease [Ostreibacterium sp.]